MYSKEKDLFPPLKKHFNERGYSVFVEVPVSYGSVDFVAVKGNEHIAVEMKLHFNAEVVRQGYRNKYYFHQSYVAVPSSMERILSMSKLAGECDFHGIGILRVLPLGNIVYVQESRLFAPEKVYDFSVFSEKETDEAGLPYQRGISEAAVDLERIKRYVAANPQSGWKEIYRNVPNHYSSYKSLAGSMKQWKGFSLYQFKEQLRMGLMKGGEFA